MNGYKLIPVGFGSRYYYTERHGVRVLHQCKSDALAYVKAQTAARLSKGK